MVSGEGVADGERLRSVAAEQFERSLRGPHEHRRRHRRQQLQQLARGQVPGGDGADGGQVEQQRGWRQGEERGGVSDGEDEPQRRQQGQAEPSLGPT